MPQSATVYFLVEPFACVYCAAIYAKGSQWDLDRGNLKAKFLDPNSVIHLFPIGLFLLQQPPYDNQRHLPSLLPVQAPRSSPSRSQTSPRP